MFINPARIPTTGNALLDAAHVRLAQIANRAFFLWQSGAPSEKQFATIEELVSMVETHFHQEEQMLRRSGYEHLGEHVRLHAEFLDTLREICHLADADRDASRLSIDTFNALDRLLYEHEFLADQEFWQIFAQAAPAATDAAPLIEWSDSWSVGDENIDRQHRTLANMLNRLQRLVDGKAADHVILVLMEEIAKHTVWHFSYEEKLMREHGLAGYDAHRQLHQNLLADFDVLLRAVRAEGRAALEGAVGEKLEPWLLDHMRYVDKVMGQRLASALAKM